MSRICSAMADHFVIGVVQPRKRFEGQTFCISMVLYAVLRFGLEFLRADDRGGFAGVSTSQWISIVIVAACAALWPVLKKRTDAELARFRAVPAAG